VHLVISSASYVDTVQVRLQRYLRSGELERLFALRGARYDTKPLQWYPRWKSSVVLQQPSREFLAAEDWTEEPQLVSRLDIALDLMTSTVDDAEAVHHFLDTHQVKPWRGRQTQVRFGGTTYSALGAGTSIQLVKYSDRPSKVSGQPCCHIEWRIRTPAGVQGAGVKSLRDVLRINHSAFWRKRVRLYQVDLPHLGEQLQSTAADRNTVRRGAYLWRMTGNVQELLDRYRTIAAGSLRAIGTGWIIPE